MVVLMILPLVAILKNAGFMGWLLILAQGRRQWPAKFRSLIFKIKASAKRTTRTMSLRFRTTAPTKCCSCSPMLVTIIRPLADWQLAKFQERPVQYLQNNRVVWYSLLTMGLYQMATVLSIQAMSHWRSRHQVYELSGH